MLQKYNDLICRYNDADSYFFEYIQKTLSHQGFER